MIGNGDGEEVYLQFSQQLFIFVHILRNKGFVIGLFEPRDERFPEIVLPRVGGKLFEEGAVLKRIFVCPAGVFGSEDVGCVVLR